MGLLITRRVRVALMSLPLLAALRDWLAIIKNESQAGYFCNFI